MHFFKARKNFKAKQISFFKINEKGYNNSNSLKRSGKHDGKTS